MDDSSFTPTSWSGVAGAEREPSYCIAVFHYQKPITLPVLKSGLASASSQSMMPESLANVAVQA